MRITQILLKLIDALQFLSSGSTCDNLQLEVTRRRLAADATIMNAFQATYVSKSTQTSPAACAPRISGRRRTRSISCA